MNMDDKHSISHKMFRSNLHAVYAEWGGQYEPQQTISSAECVIALKNISVVVKVLTNMMEGGEHYERDVKQALINCASASNILGSITNCIINGMMEIKD